MESTSLARVGDVRHVHLVTHRPLELALEFYEPWGLEVVGRDDGASDLAASTVRFRASGPQHHVLQLRRGDHVGLEHIAFEARSRVDVIALHRRFAGAGVELLGDPATIDAAGGGWGFSLRDPEGRVLEISTEVAAADPRPVGLPLPVRITHIVLNTTDIDLLCDFYVDVLGFRVSDWSEHQMVFLRSGRDHHSIAFNAADHVSVNHIAYELPSLDAYLTSIGRMKRAGIEPYWGPGRHGPGNNTFAYYIDPVGFVPEFTSEVLPIDEESWVPRVWQRTPAQSDLWGTAGPPSPEIRAAMHGTADPAMRSPHPVPPTPTTPVPVP